MSDGQGQALYRRARSLIPGGTQLLSKRPEMFLPDEWPSYYRTAAGAVVTDLDGREYIDMSHNGIGACILGHHDPDVDAAVHQAIDSGSMSTLNCPEEVELAELLLEMHPWAQEVRYARTGGEAMAVAVRIARTHTRRDKVAFCGYHGWHDWYLAANLGSEDHLDGHLLQGLSPRGVPRGLAGTAMPFSYNDLEALASLFEENSGEIAAVVMEPIRNHQPEPGFLEGVRKLCNEHSAVLIMDEITAGFRLNWGGAHATFGVRPDIAVYAKGLSNGYAMAAVVGRSEVMDAAQDTFISSTYWTERIGPSAALATIRKHRAESVEKGLNAMGQAVKKVWRNVAKSNDISIRIGGLDPLAHFSIEGEDGTAAETLFTRRMLKAGFLANGTFYATHAHEAAHVEAYESAAQDAFAAVAQARADESLSSLVPRPHQVGFQRLT